MSYRDFNLMAPLFILRSYATAAPGGTFELQGQRRASRVPTQVPSLSSACFSDHESSIFSGGSTGTRTLDLRIKNPQL